MRIEDLCEGMRIRIKDYDIDDLPEHWNEDGEMNEWIGRTVTIDEVHHGDGSISIKEDGGHWCFYASDFQGQIFSEAEKKNPNFLFSRTPIRRS